MDTIKTSRGGFFMKTFTKVFLVSFFFFFIAFFSGSVAYLKDNDMDVVEHFGFGHYEKEDIAKTIINKLETSPKEEKVYSSLEDALSLSPRVNFLILGMEDVRADSILLVSFNKDSKKLDVISIPRDTYIHRKGFDSGEERKINSIYYKHGTDGLMKTVSYILDDIPIHHYVMLDYKGVENIVDIVGGVEIKVPFDMVYNDPYAKPPLNINIKKGIQTLDGKNALDFIRWRKGNKKVGYIDGDIGRIKAQQTLLSSLALKAKENIIPIITKGYKYVETDIGIMDILSYGRAAIGIENEKISFKTLPGKSDLRPIGKKIYSYYVHNQKEVRSLLEEIYNVKKQ